MTAAREDVKGGRLAGAPRLTGAKDLKKQIVHDRRPFTHENENLSQRPRRRQRPQRPKESFAFLATFARDFAHGAPGGANAVCLWRMCPKKQSETLAMRGCLPGVTDLKKRSQRPDGHRVHAFVFSLSVISCQLSVIGLWPPP
jgi:hypothetical protein